MHISILYMCVYACKRTSTKDGNYHNNADHALYDSIKFYELII